MAVKDAERYVPIPRAKSRTVLEKLTHERLEVKFTNFGRVDHLWPHKAGDCVYL